VAARRRQLPGALHALGLKPGPAADETTSRLRKRN
jgi:hypothetical protein